MDVRDGLEHRHLGQRAPAAPPGRRRTALVAPLTELPLGGLEGPLCRTGGSARTSCSSNGPEPRADPSWRCGQISSAATRVSASARGLAGHVTCVQLLRSPDHVLGHGRPGSMCPVRKPPTRWRPQGRARSRRRHQVHDLRFKRGCPVAHRRVPSRRSRGPRVDVVLAGATPARARVPDHRIQSPSGEVEPDAAGRHEDLELQAGEHPKLLRCLEPADVGAQRVEGGLPLCPERRVPGDRGPSRRCRRCRVDPRDAPSSRLIWATSNVGQPRPWEVVLAGHLDLRLAANRRKARHCAAPGPVSGEITASWIRGFGHEPRVRLGTVGHVSSAARECPTVGRG